jgi:hypothetical protein
MRKIFLGFLIIAAIGLVSCDDSKKKMFPFGSGSETASQEGTSGNVPADQVNDQQDTKEFKYQTIHDVSFDLQLYDETNNPLAKAVVRLNTAEGDITNAISAENGTLSFKASLSNSLETISIIVEHPNCVTKTVEIADIQKLSQVSRTIFLELRAEAKAKPDRDGDGVPDDADEFPDDPSLIGSTTGEYTIAYEDLWPAKGDADMNDLVVRLRIKEYIDNNNMISKITVTAKLLAAGAGYKNQLWINVLGKDYELIFNPKQDLNGKYNTKQKEDYVQGPEHKVEIALNPAVARDQMDAMPYDPYIRCNGNDKNQVHLSFVKSKFKGQVLDTDGFPWAILVPADWAWPYEGTSIFQAYPEFQKWYASKGAEYKEWYLHPELTYVYKVSVGTALAAYLMKVSTHVPDGVVIATLLAMVIAILGINIWRKRSENMSA